LLHHRKPVSLAIRIDSPVDYSPQRAIYRPYPASRVFPARPVSPRGIASLRRPGALFQRQSVNAEELFRNA